MSDNITISLPKGLNEKIEKEVKMGKFKSKSEFLLFVLRGWEKMADSALRISPKKIKKIREVKLTPDEKIAIERAEDDIKHKRFAPYEEFVNFLRR